VEDCGQSGLNINELAQLSIEDSVIRNNAGDGLAVDAITSVDDGYPGSITPNAGLVNARDLLLATSPTTSQGQTKVTEAVAGINAALLASYWADEWHPDPNADGKKIFEKVKKDALEKLKDFTNPDKDAELGNTPAVKANIVQAITWLVEATEDLAKLARDEAVYGNGDAGKIEDADEEAKKAYKEIDKGHFHHAADKFKKCWEKAIEAGGTAQGTKLGWDAGNDNDNPPDALMNRHVTINGSDFVNNDCGIRFVTSQTLDVRTTNLSQNAQWGVSLADGGLFEQCTFDSNGVGGLRITDSSDADLTVNGLTFTNNIQYGFFAQACQLTFNATILGSWSMSGNGYAFSADGGTMTFDGVTVSGGDSAGVMASDATLTVQNATFQNNGYGVAADNSTVVVDNATLTQNSVGLYSHESDVTLRDSSVHDNTVWGATLYCAGIPGVVATIENSAIYNNAGGIAVINASDGDVSLISGTVIQDNTGPGLHFDNCDLNLPDQAGGAKWRTLRNGSGISSVGSTLQLANLAIEDSSGYGVFCENSDVTMANCTVSGQSGLYADASNLSLSVSSSRFNGTAVGNGGWGAVRYGGDVSLTNCLFDGFDNGIFLDTAAETDQASVTHTTVANVIQTAVQLAGGSASVINTILHGNNAIYGFDRQGGDLMHSHNLLEGFASTFSGTSADASEVLKNPLFLDDAAGDFHLQNGSPAINAGTDVGTVPVDLDGAARPSHRAFEIGAYEYTSPGGSTRILRWSEAR